MASLRELRRRLKSIQSTKQIMRAMQLVSGSKFKRAQLRLLQSRQMLEFLDGLLQRVLVAAEGRNPERSRARPKAESRESRGTAKHLQHPLMTARAGLPSALLVVTSDAGLAGSYNTNLIQLTEAELRKDTAKAVRVSFLGKRGHRYFVKRGSQPADAFLDLAGRPDIRRIDAIGTTLMDRFLKGEIGSVHILYAKFISPTVSKPTVAQWLPIQLGQTSSPSPQPRAPSRGALDYIFEPSAEEIFADLLPRWAIATFRLFLLEAFTSEHGARMIAMKNATDNAEELLKSLTLQRNKVRQASITRELSEIVGTVEALK